MAVRRRPRHRHRRILDSARVGETYHVGSGFEASVRTIADTVLAELGLPASRIETVPDRPSHDRRYLLDSSKLRAELGWAPQHTDLRSGLVQTIAWYTDNRWWWEADKATIEQKYAERGQ